MISFSQTLQKAKLLRRYKRFFADAELPTGEVVTAHCPNTGSMATCADPGSTIWLSHNSDPKRKLQWTWQLTETAQGYIGVNTARPNQIVENAIDSNLIPELSGYSAIRREVRYGVDLKSRIDLLLESPNKKTCYVEVKNTTLLSGDTVIFPDAVTERGQKHIGELLDVIRKGHRGVMFFLVNRPEGQSFRAASEIDPVYANLLYLASQKGLEVIAYRAVHTIKNSTLGERVRVQLHPPQTSDLQTKSKNKIGKAKS